jgi:D-alanyl-D-alanine carboxypeptidase (penicillin-binding protein 5/6)
MTQSTFANANGWPAAGHRMSVHDLAILASRLITDFPEFYPLFAETEFAFDGRAPSNTQNRNPLLKLGIGADGLKTGHTAEAGYGMVGSARQGDRRVIFVLSGLGSTTMRAEEAEALVNWSFRQFGEKTIARAGTPVAQAAVWMGQQRSVGLVPAEDFRVLLPALAGNRIAAEVVYTGPVNAPIHKGQRLAELVLKPDNMSELRLPLVAQNDVPAGGFLVRVRTAAERLMTRFAAGPAGARSDQ